MDKEKLTTSPSLYDPDLKAITDRLSELTQLICDAEPFIAFEQVVNKTPQWWVKPDSVHALRNQRCIRVTWQTPAQKVFQQGLLDAYANYREAYIEANGGENYEEEYDALKVKFAHRVEVKLKGLANNHHVELSYFTRIYQHLQTELEKAGPFKALRTEAVVVSEPVLVAYLKQVRSREFKARSQFPFCTFCYWIGHQRNQCKAYEDAPTCEFCKRKGHDLNKCRKAPVCEHCLEKGHTDKSCVNGPRCRFCRMDGHLVWECAKLKKIRCHRCGQYGHTASRCVSEITFQDE